MYRLHSREMFAKRRDYSVEETVEGLERLGYEYQGLSAIKKHPSRGILDRGSYRKVPDKHPDIDVRITREWEPEDCQYHIHIFDTGNCIHLTSHYELCPDFFSPDINLDRIYNHYRPVYGENYIEGATSHRIAEL